MDADEQETTLSIVEAEQALDALLTAIQHQDDTREEVEGRGPVLISALASWSARDKLPRHIRQLLKEPVRAALKQGVRDLGEAIGKQHGYDPLTEAFDRVAAMKPEHASRRMMVMDSAWNGIETADGGLWVS